MSLKTGNLMIISALYNRIWDEADYVIPPADNGAFFVATNVVITPNQTRGDISISLNLMVKFLTVSGRSLEKQMSEII